MLIIKEFNRFPYNCKICKRECKNILSLTIHLRRSHNISKNDYLIKYCGYSTNHCIICEKEILIGRQYCSPQYHGKDENWKKRLVDGRRKSGALEK